MQQYITQITRQSSRVLKVTLGRRNSWMPIQILPTYAPHNGHAEADRRQHWGKVKELLNKTCKRRVIIWCADANGHRERKRGKREKCITEKDAHRKIGPYDRSKPEKGNGAYIAGICQKQQMIPMPTWEEPKKERADTWENTNADKIRPKRDGGEKWKTNTSQRGQAQAGS